MPVEGFFFLEYRRYSPDLSLRIIQKWMRRGREVPPGFECGLGAGGGDKDRESGRHKQGLRLRNPAGIAYAFLLHWLRRSGMVNRAATTGRSANGTTMRCKAIRIAGAVPYFVMAVVTFFSINICAAHSAGMAAAATGPAPLLGAGHPVTWWFVFKFNAANFPARTTDGNTPGTTKDNDVKVSQHFFALKLNRDDVVKVLAALNNASVVTDAQNPQLVESGGPPDIQQLVNTLGKRCEALSGIIGAAGRGNGTDRGSGAIGSAVSHPGCVMVRRSSRQVKSTVTAPHCG